MIKPTKNRVTQTAEEHGYPATDYWYSPDPYIYAPITGSATAGGNPNNTPNDPTNCGWQIEIKNSKYRFRFCHAKQTTWRKANFTEGQKIGIIGWSGFTNPAGQGGRHLHVVMWTKRFGLWRRVADPDKEMDKLIKDRDKGYMAYDKYSDYKADNVFIYGKAPRGTYTKWVDKYKTWTIRRYLRQVAKTQYNNVTKLKEQVQTQNKLIVELEADNEAKTKEIAKLKKEAGNVEGNFISRVLDSIKKWLDSLRS